MMADRWVEVMVASKEPMMFGDSGLLWAES